MKRNVLLLAGLLLGSSFLPLSASGQPTGQGIDAEALSIFEAMIKRISTADELSVRYIAGYDIVQEHGQKIEFSERRTMTLSRPHQLRTEARLSDGGERVVVFDGEKTSILDVDENIYAQMENKGSVDDALRYLVRTLKVRVPMARMFVSNASEEFGRLLQSLSYVEDSVLTEMPTAHLAGRTEEIDFQVWIPLDGEPLPRRLVITYKELEAAPQFWALFEEWNLSPRVDASEFEFNPPDGAEKIPFLIRVRQAETSDVEMERQQ